MHVQRRCNDSASAGVRANGKAEINAVMTETARPRPAALLQ
jgi:hypothetical protein